jgi:hypothetical protein
MRYRLDADHYDEFNLLPAGTIVGDGCEVSWKYLPTVADPKLRNAYKPPSMEMTPLDDEAKRAYNERFGSVPFEKDPTNKISLFGGINPSDTGSAAPHTIAFTGKPTVAPPGRPNPAPNNPTEKPHTGIDPTKDDSVAKEDPLGNKTPIGHKPSESLPAGKK